MHDLERFRKFEKGWDSYDADPPNDGAIRLTKNMIVMLETHGVDVNYVQPSVEGGLALIMVGQQPNTSVKEQHWVKIECDNDGDIGVCLSDGRVWFIMEEFITVKESIDKIKEWLLN